MRRLMVPGPAIALACAIACGATPPAATKPARGRGEAASHEPHRVRPAPIPQQDGGAPAQAPIDVHAEPWRDSNDAQHGTPQCIVVDPADPVSVFDGWPARFHREPPRAFRLALALISRVRLAVKSSRWREERRTRCCDTRPDGVSRALVTDQSGKIRALIERGGSDDSAQTARLFYDEDERLRFLFLTNRNYTGAHSEQLAAFDERGMLTACDYLVLRRGDWMQNLCAGPDGDPQAWKQTTFSNPDLDSYVMRNPRQAFDRCLRERSVPADR